MCGIIAVLRQPSSEPVADVVALADLLEPLAGLLESSVPEGPGPVRPDAIEQAAADLSAVDHGLRGVAGVEGLLGDPAAASRIEAAAEAARGQLAVVESSLDDVSSDIPHEQMERTNAAVLSCKDALWAITQDRLRAARGVAELAPRVPGRAGLAVLLSLHQSLSALDRLEVRGRDSAGIEVQLTGHGLDPGDHEVADALAARRSPLFTSGAARLVDGVLVLVHKVAAEIGELGDNTAALRAALRSDQLLHAAIGSDDVLGTVLGHTRWASIGIVSEPNAHPQSSDESKALDGPFVTAVLNGDVDNYADLAASDGLHIPPEIGTDAKVIPTLVRRALGGGAPDTVDAFRETVARLEGSVAIAATSTEEPGEVLLALRGSGQALYVGVADEAFVVASEPYGVVEETHRYLRLDGETPSDPDHPTASRGQVVALRSDRAGTLDGIRRVSYDGTELPVTGDDLVSAQITTRDIDRGDHPHFLLKEVTDSPHSFRTTLRGRLVETDGRMTVDVGPDTLPEDLAARLADGTIHRILVIGQGTAAVAGQSLEHQLGDLLADTGVRVEALPATELSGFRMRPDMSDTLVVAISQSGTTTDTNRTVDLVRSRGAGVIAIVNRRNSDLTDKSDGVLYTSDGRDVEMSVASTKAFYAQVAAGILLAYALAAHVPGARDIGEPAEQDALRALRDLPEKMEQTLATRPQVAAAARTHAPSRRYWAIVGNGTNQIAARELRIKLSELCYKSIACDATEDKKHIDLSAEPLILVCATGLVGSTADDVAKEVAIFRAHKAAPIAVVSEGNSSMTAALDTLVVPSTHERLAFVLCTIVGHLFGYEAALAIDAQAQPLRHARAAIDELVAGVDLAADGEPVDGAGLLASLRPRLGELAAQWAAGMRDGVYDGHLQAATAVRLAGLFRYATGTAPLDGYQVEFGKAGTPGVVLDDLTAALTVAIEELTRPVDAIKHQAKTVTVGISRSDESLLQVPLVAAALDSGAGRDSLPYSSLRSLAELDAAVTEVTGHTRYRIDGGDDLPTATLTVVGRGGLGGKLRSRTESDPRLRGTKALVAREQELMVAVGRSDGRTVVIVPEIRDGTPVGLVLLHVRLADHLPAATARSVLQGYRRRYQALRDAVTETEDELDEEILAAQPVVDLLVVPILDLADRWRR